VAHLPGTGPLGPDVVREAEFTIGCRPTRVAPPPRPGCQATRRGRPGRRPPPPFAV